MTNRDYVVTARTLMLVIAFMSFTSTVASMVKGEWWWVGAFALNGVAAGFGLGFINKRMRDES